MKSHWMSLGIYSVCASLGLALLLYPFILPIVVTQTNGDMSRANEMPLLMTVLMGLVLLVLLYEVQGQMLNAKTIALLGVLVAINSTLRFVEVAIPGPGGFSPIFFLIILTGYIFGGFFGFLMGALTLFVSALITGGVGPWLPCQMFVAGWIGMSAPLCRPIARRLGVFHQRGEVIILALFGILWGFAYGALLNLWTWPFISGPVALYWSQGIGWTETLRRYAAYYLVTSLVWDIAAAGGNFILLLFLGEPTLKVLRRFQQRLSFQYQPDYPELTDKANPIPLSQQR